MLTFGLSTYMCTHMHVSVHVHTHIHKTKTSQREFCNSVIQGSESSHLQRNNHIGKGVVVSSFPRKSRFIIQLFQLCESGNVMQLSWNPVSSAIKSDSRIRLLGVV